MPDLSTNEPDPFADLPETLRIDLGLAVLSSMAVQEGGGWSAEELAELFLVTPAAIRSRIHAATASARAVATNLSQPLNP